MKIIFLKYGMVAGLIYFFCTACNEEEPSKIIGSWEAVKLTEEDKPLEVDLEEISFHFTDDQSYEFTSTLNYREAGSYYLKSDMLYTTDTLNQASTEKIVEIIRMEEDTLLIRMDQNGKERQLKLARQAAPTTGE